MGLSCAFSNNQDPVYIAKGFGEDASSLKLLVPSSTRKAKNVLLTGKAADVLLSSSFYPSSNPDFELFLMSISPPDGAVSVLSNVVHFDKPVRTLSTGATSLSDDPLVSYRDAQNQLGEAFGTKRRKQALSSLEKNRINTDKLAATSSKYISKSIDSKSNPPSRSSTPAPGPNGSLVDNGFLPVFDPNAEEISQIFPHVIPLAIVSHICYLCEDESFVNSVTWNAFFDRIPKASSLQVRLYLQVLLSLILRNEHRHDGALFSRLPEELVSFLIANFLEKADVQKGAVCYRFTDTKKDRLISFITVACLALDGSWICNLYALSLATKVPVNKIHAGFKNIGCNIVSHVPGREHDKVHAMNGKTYPSKFAVLTSPPKVK